MHRPHRVVLPLLLGVALSAQARMPVFGRVLDLDGKPVANATVTLFWTPPGDALGEHTDRVELATDARGGFVAQLLPQVGYSAFAVGPEDAGERMVSEVRDGVAAGADVALRLCEPSTAVEVELRGSEAWQAEGPLQLLEMPLALNLLPRRVALRAGKASLPYAGLRTFAVLDAKGQLLWALSTPATDGRYQLDLPPPVELSFRVVDAGQQPVTGAEVVQPLQALGGPAMHTLVWGALATPLRRLGTTDADGRVTARVPAVGDPWREPNADLVFVARKPGCGSVASGLASNNYYCNGEKTTAPADHVIGFELRQPVRLQLPDAGAAVTLASDFHLCAGGQAMSRKWAVPGAVDADGCLELPVVGADASGLLEIAPMRLAGGRLLPRALMQVAADALPAKAVPLRRVAVQIRNSDGGPAHGVITAVIPLEQLFPETVPAFTDQAGRTEFRVGPGDWLLFACDEGHAGWRLLNASDGDQQWQLQLTELPSMQCRIVDASGAPVAGACVMQSRGDLPDTFPHEGVGRLLGVLEQMFAHRLVRSLRSDAEGRLSVPMLGKVFSWRLTFGLGHKTSGEVVWATSSTPVTLKID